MYNFKNNKGTSNKTGLKNKTFLENKFYLKFDSDNSDSENLDSQVNELEYSEETDF